MTFPLLLAGSLHLKDDYVLFQWFVGLSVICAGLSYSIYRAYGPVAGISLFYFILSGLWVGLFSFNQYEKEFFYKPYFSLGAMAGVACLVLFSIVALVSEKSTLFNFECSFPFWGLSNSLFVILGAITGAGKFPGGVGYSGFIDYSGMNGVLLALLLPFAFDLSLFGAICVVLSSIAMWLSKSSVPLGVTAVVAVSYLFHDIKYKRVDFNKAITWVSCALIFVLLGSCFEGKPLFHTAGRFEAYKVFMRAWYHYAPKLTGSGLGTFSTLAPIIQNNTGFMTHQGAADASYYWIWMHSDWLQILFEAGILGFSLALVLFLSVLLKLYKNKSGAAAFSMACGLGSAAIFDFPMRYFGMSLLAVYALAYTKDTKCQKRM